MEFIIEKKKLLDCLNHFQSVVEKRNTIPIGPRPDGSVDPTYSMKPVAVVEISVPLAFSSVNDRAVIGLSPLVKVQTLYVKKTMMPQKPVDRALAMILGSSPLTGVLVCTAVLKANQTIKIFAIIDNALPIRAEL